MRKMRQLEEDELRDYYLTLFCFLQLINNWTVKDFLHLAASKEPRAILSKDGFRFFPISDLAIGRVFGEQALAEDKAR